MAHTGLDTDWGSGSCLALATFLLLIMAGIIHAASFDCEKAASKVERIICGNDVLSKLDESLNTAYLKALERPDIRKQLIKSQRQWLKNERNACQNAECLKRAYENRIWELGLSSSYGTVFFRSPDRITSSPKALPEESKSQPTEPRGQVIQTEPGQEQEPTVKRLGKSETEPSVNEQLRQATYKGSLEQIKTLLTKGADLNAKGSFGQTVLMEAALYGRLDLVRFLIDKGADEHAKNNFDSTVLMAAARSRNVQVVKYLIDRRANVNARDSGGETALTKAVRTENGNLEIIKLLIDQGADVNARCKDGSTVFTTAVKDGNLETVKFLVDKGADVNEKDETGKTVLMAAVEKGRFQVAKFLIDRRANVNAKDQYSRTALWEAADGEDLETVKSLVDRGGDVNAKDNFGRTPLMNAVSRKRVDIVKFLIDREADVNAKDQYGRTALSLASDKNQPDIVQYLKAHGAKFSEVSTCVTPGDEDFPEQGVLTFLSRHTVYHVEDGETETADQLMVWNKNPKEMCFSITTVTNNYHTCSLDGKAIAISENEYSYTENKCHVIFTFVKDEVRVKVKGPEDSRFCGVEDLDEGNGCGMNTGIDSAIYKKSNEVYQRGY